LRLETVGFTVSQTKLKSSVALFHALSVTVNLITNVPSVSELIVVAIASLDPKVIVPAHETLLHT